MSYSPPGLGLFVTGTDTGVGKTTVTAALARVLRRQGCPVRVSKPVATGARLIGDQCLSEDTIQLADAAGETALAEITPWAWPEPVAPPVAARLAGATVTLKQVVEAVRRRAGPGEFLLVEGVGGLLCPLTEEDTIADLADAVGLPLLVVARRALGTLNHTLLTLEAAARRGLTVVGVVIVETTRPEGLAEGTNIEELRRRIAPPILAVVPFQPNRPVDAVPALAAVDWSLILGLNECLSGLSPEEQISAWRP